MHLQTVCNKTNKCATLCSATTYAQNVALPAFVRCMPAVQQSIDISYPPSPQQQTCSSGVWRPDGTDRQTDGRMDAPPDRCIDPALDVVRAVPTTYRFS